MPNHIFFIWTKCLNILYLQYFYNLITSTAYYIRISQNDAILFMSPNIQNDSIFIHFHVKRPFRYNASSILDPHDNEGRSVLWGSVDPRGVQL